MSRCFPFPPPGYEKKARSDEADVLKKEKQKEKKHKKEKKDKEKRESKEKKEKDRSDEKHREKKEKKEKHRDKKEKKDRDKDKVKSGNSDEKRIPGNLGVPDGGRSSNEKKFPGKYDAHSGEKIVQKEKEKGKDRNSISGEKKFAGYISGYTGEKLGQNSYQAGDIKDPKFMQDLGGRIRDEDRETGNKLVDKFSGRDTKRDEGMVRMVTKATGSLDEGMEKKKKDTKGVDRKLDVQSIKDEARFGGNTMVQNPAGMVPTRVDGMPQPVEKDVERTLGKEKTKEKEGDDKRGDKRKDKNREKKAQGKDKDRDKEKKKEEKAKIKSQHKNSEKDTLKGSNKDDHLGAHNKQTLHSPVDGDKGIIEQNVRKRKDLETNGFVHDIDTKPNKLPRPTSSSHPLKENNKWPEVTSSSHSLTGNGKILESCQTSVPLKGAANSSITADKKELKVNGIIASQALSVPAAAKPTAAQIDQIPEVSLRPPHPDSKYLSQVLLVPEMEDCCHFDDQEWLFHNSNSESKKPKVGCSGEDETPQVWAEAVPIESADVCALPYVIPY